MDPSRLLSRATVPLLCLGVAVTLTAVLAVPFSRWMLFPGGPTPFPPRESLSRLAPAARLASYSAPGGPALTGAYFPPASAADPVALYFHGNAESAALNLGLAEELHATGLGVFLAEYRGYGGCPGRPTEKGLYADGEAALDWLVASGVPVENVVPVGRSLGCGVAVELALRRPPRGVVLVSAYTSVVDMGRLVVGPLAPLVVLDRFDNLGKIARVRAPVTLIHGTRDEVVPVAMGRKLSAARPDARWVELPGASHNDVPGLGRLLAEAVRGLR